LTFQPPEPPEPSEHQRILQIYALNLSLQVASMKFAEEDLIILSNPLGDLMPQ
jgi:hypothetical protein